MVSKLIEQAQTKVEGYNFDMRKNVVDYDDVIAKQREVIYGDRRAVLERADLHERVLSMMRAEVGRVVDSFIPGSMVSEEEELERLFLAMETWVGVPEEVVPENIHAARREDIKNKLADLVVEHYEERCQELDARQAEYKDLHPDSNVFTIRDLERAITLQVIDQLWMDHIDMLDVMRASIHFRALAQRDPLVEFKNEAFHMFEDLKLTIERSIVNSLLRTLRNEQFALPSSQPQPKRKAPRKLRTNANDIAKAAGQAKSDDAEDRPKANARRNSAAKSQSNGHSRGNTMVAAANMAPRPVPAKVGRNDPCPCGSGKKYKKCHGA